MHNSPKVVFKNTRPIRREITERPPPQTNGDRGRNFNTAPKYAPLILQKFGNFLKF